MNEMMNEGKSAHRIQYDIASRKKLPQQFSALGMAVEVNE